MMKHVQKRKSYSDDSSGMGDELSSSEEHVCRQPNTSHEMLSETIPTRTEDIGCNISHPRDSIIKHFLPEKDDNIDEKWLFTIAPLASYDDDSLILDSSKVIERKVHTDDKTKRSLLKTQTGNNDDVANQDMKSDGKFEKSTSFNNGYNIEKYGIVYGQMDSNNNKSNENTKNSKRSEEENLTKKREKIRYVSKTPEILKTEDIIYTSSPNHPSMNGEISNSLRSLEKISPKEKRKEKISKKNENEKKSSKFLDKLKSSKKNENEKTQSPKINKKKNLSKLKESIKDDVLISQKELKFNLSKYTEKLKTTSFRSSPSTKKKVEDENSTLKTIKHGKKETSNSDNQQNKSEPCEDCIMSRDKDESDPYKIENKKENISHETTHNIKKPFRSKSFIFNSFRKPNENSENHSNTSTPATRPRSLILGRKFPQNLISSSKDYHKSMEKFKSADSLHSNTKKSIFHFKTFKSRSVEKVNSRSSSSNVKSLGPEDNIVNKSDRLDYEFNECFEELNDPHSIEKRIANDDLFTKKLPTAQSEDDIKMKVFFATSDKGCTLDRRHSFGPSSSRKKTINNSIVNKTESTDGSNGKYNTSKVRTRKVIVRCRSKSFTPSSDDTKYDCDVFHEKILPATSSNSLHVPIINVSKSCENVKMRCIFYKDYESDQPVKRSKSFGGRSKKDPNVKSKLKVVDKLLAVSSSIKERASSSQRSHGLPDTDPEYITTESYRKREANELSSENTTEITPILPSFCATQYIQQANEKISTQQSERLTHISAQNVNNGYNHDTSTGSTSSDYELIGQKKDHRNNIRETNKPTNLDELVQSVESNKLQLKKNERLLLTNEQRLSIISELLRKIDVNSNVIQGAEKKSIEVQVSDEMKSKSQYVEEELCSKMKTNKIVGVCSLNKLDGDSLTEEIQSQNTKADAIKAKVNGEQLHNMSANELLSRLNLEVLRSISYIKYRPSDQSKGEKMEPDTELGPNDKENGTHSELGFTTMGTNHEASSIKSRSITNEEILDKELKLIEELFQNIDSKELLKELNFNDTNLNLPKSALLTLKDKLESSELQPKSTTFENEKCRIQDRLINIGDAPSNKPPVPFGCPRSKDDLPSSSMNPSIGEIPSEKIDTLTDMEMRITDSPVSDEIYEDKHLIRNGEEHPSSDTVIPHGGCIQRKAEILKEEVGKSKANLDFVDSIPFENEIFINKANLATTAKVEDIRKLPVNEKICANTETAQLQIEPRMDDVNWYDEVFDIDIHTEDEGKSKIAQNHDPSSLSSSMTMTFGTIPSIQIETIKDGVEEQYEVREEILACSKQQQNEISEEEIHSCEDEEQMKSDFSTDYRELMNEIKVNENTSMSSDSGVSLLDLSGKDDVSDLETEFISRDRNTKSSYSQIPSIDCEEIENEDKEVKSSITETVLPKFTTERHLLPNDSRVVRDNDIEIRLVDDNESKSDSMSSKVNAFNIEDIDSGTELQYDDLFSPTDARENDGDYNSWLTSIKPLLCDCEVVANLFSRLANKYCDYKESGKKAYYMQQVHMATTAYDVITDNNLTNFSSVISIMLSFVGAIKAEKPPPNTVNIPNILIFLQQLVEKGSLSSFHITLFTVLLSRPNEKLKKHHNLRVNLLHTCFVQEMRQLRLTSSELQQLCVTFIKISEYFVHFDMKLTLRLVEEHILPRLTHHNDVAFISNVLVYMGLNEDNKNENTFTTNDVSSSLVLLNLIYKRKPLSSSSRQKLYMVLQSENSKFRFCDSEKETLIETIADLEHSICKLLDP